MERTEPGMWDRLTIRVSVLFKAIPGYMVR